MKAGRRTPRDRSSIQASYQVPAADPRFFVRVAVPFFFLRHFIRPGNRGRLLFVAVLLTPFRTGAKLRMWALLTGDPGVDFEDLMS